MCTRVHTDPPHIHTYMHIHICTQMYTYTQQIHLLNYCNFHMRRREVCTINTLTVFLPPSSPFLSLSPHLSLSMSLSIPLSFSLFSVSPPSPSSLFLHPFLLLVPPSHTHTEYLCLSTQFLLPDPFCFKGNTSSCPRFGGDRKAPFVFLHVVLILRPKLKLTVFLLNGRGEGNLQAPICLAPSASVLLTLHIIHILPSSAHKEDAR